MAEVNPEIPLYAQTAPAVSDKCGGACSTLGLNLILPPIQGGGGKNAEVLGGFSINSTDLSDVNTDRFLIDFFAYEDVAVALVIIAKAATVPKSNPVLAGTVIDEVECVWSYNAIRDGDINVQSIVNTGAGSDPTLLATDRAFDYIGLTITAAATITITGQDTISNDSDAKSITFGNYLATGVSDPSMLFRDPDTDTQAIFDALNIKSIKTTQQNHSFDAFGAASEFMVIAHPASFGESQFTKGSFTGGYQQIFLVNRGGNNIFVNEILGGDTPADINIDNGNGQIEPYFFYQSEFPARTGDQPTILTKL